MEKKIIISIKSKEDFEIPQEGLDKTLAAATEYIDVDSDLEISVG